MKPLNLALAQTCEELKFILNKINKNLTCVPISLETLMYCEKKK